MGIDDRDRLLRIAYGAGSTDAERADAVAAIVRLDEATRREEAAALARAAEAAVARHAAASARGAALREGRADPLTPLAPTGARTDGPGALRLLARAREALGLRALVVGIGATLAVGVAAGWTLGTAAAGTRPGSLVQAAGTEPVDALDVDHARATGVFARSSEVTDVPKAPIPEMWGIDESTVRDLRSSDGIRAYGARSASGLNVCLLVVYGDSIAHACTECGRFPDDGLTATTVGYDGVTPAQVTWRADGTTEFLGGDAG